MCIGAGRSREEEDGVFTAVADVALEVTLFAPTANCRPETSLEKDVGAFSKAPEQSAISPGYG